MRKFILAIVLLLSTTFPVLADQYYFVLFSYDSKPIAIPCLSHIWGEFVQTTDDGKLVKRVTISWEPDKISYLNEARPGHNSNGQLDFAVSHNKKICMWGPFAITGSTFGKAEMQATAQGKYRFLDGHHRDAQNCIHRVGDIPGSCNTGIYWGWWAGDAVCKHYKRKGIVTEVSNPKLVIDLLGIDKYPVERK